MTEHVQTTSTARWTTCVKAVLKGSGQVMFQGNGWTGLLFLIGIFIGAYQEGQPPVAWGALVGLMASTLAGMLLHQPADEGNNGLWGFNGILVGCAFPTFLGNTPLMWTALVLGAMMSTWIRTGFNHVMASWKTNSLTFPFVFTSWIFLLAARMLKGLPPEYMSAPELTATLHTALDTSPGSLFVYWLKGIAQVFLINSWVTGIFFLAALFVSSRWAALWAAVGSALALGVALLYQAAGSSIASGLYGFSPVLTAIALGCTFYQPGWRSALWALTGIVATVFIQAGMNALMMPFGLPTFTAPFCVATWLFLLPLYKLDEKEPDHSAWHKRKKLTHDHRTTD
ncbi:MAG: urea transporter [Coprobacter sp.]|nr:urea transporter [Coprobacter sp.]